MFLQLLAEILDQSQFTGYSTLINSSCEFNGHYKFEWLILSPFLQILALSFKQHLIVDIFNSYHLSAWTWIDPVWKNSFFVTPLREKAL